jgi:hypothetical protein
MYVIIRDINGKEFEHRVIGYSDIFIEDSDTGKKETLELLLSRLNESNY